MALPERKNFRAEFHDYSGGDYFVTICTANKEHYFGHIVGTHDSCVRSADHAGSTGQRTHGPCVPTTRSALSVIVGGFKRSVTMYARRNSIKFGWQGRFYDHIIRGVKDGNTIAEYIQTNVAKWDSDCFNC